MSTRIIHKNAVVSEDELAEAYHRAVTYRNTEAQHVAPWSPDRFDAEYIAFVENGRRPTGGFGHHRDNTNRRDGKYAAFRYPVVETATYPVVDSLGNELRGWMRDAEGNLFRAVA